MAVMPALYDMGLEGMHRQSQSKNREERDKERLRKHRAATCSCWGEVNVRRLDEYC